MLSADQSFISHSVVKMLLLRLCVMSLVVLLVKGISDAPLDSKCVSRHCQRTARELIESTDLIYDPCDDFYRYACGHFADKYGVPSGEVLWDYFQMLQDTMDNISTSILQSPIAATDPVAVVKAKDMFAACMQVECHDDGLGLNSLLKLLSDWGNWPVLDTKWKASPPDWNSLADLIADFAVQFLFSIESLANLDNANTTALYIDSPNLGLPSPLLKMAQTLDLLRDVRSAEGTEASYPITQYLVTVATLLRQLLKSNVTDEAIEKDMVDIILFMQKLSQRPSGSESTIKQVGELDAWMAQQLGNSSTTTLKWMEFLQRVLNRAGVQVTTDTLVIISNPSAVAYIVNLVENTDPRLFRNYVISRLLVFLSPESSREMWEAAFRFYVQQGYISQDYPRWQYCLHKVMDYPYIGFSHAVAYQYRTTFESRKLEEAKQMVSNLMSAFKELLEENEWMDDETRKKASEKVDAMYVLVGFPTWTDSSAQLDEFYKEMVVNRSDHFGNVARLRSFAQAINLATLGKPRDRNNWTQSPLVVNAFYNSLNNRITFPVGMMSDPFFSGDKREKALDYGRIGAIVGHEITHGFDSMGRLYDNFGTAANWWSDVTEQKFTERAQCFVDQYTSFKVMEINATVDGSTTLRENIADNGGVREAFRAFKRTQARIEPRLPGLEQYTPEQLFFLGYATMWCRAETLQGLETMQGDSHSPNRFRVIGSLSNMKEFSEVFQCPEGSRMNPINKCVLW